MKLSRDFDWLVLFTTFLLCSIGLALIYSVFHPPESGFVSDTTYFYLKRQVFWLGFAMIAMVLGIAVPIRIYESLAFTVYVGCVLLLVAVLLIPSDQETQRWLILGPVRLQPSELTKIAVILVWARLLSSHTADPNRLRHAMPALIYFAIPFLLVLKQPDLGTALVFAGLLLPVMYWRGFNPYSGGRLSVGGL